METGVPLLEATGKRELARWAVCFLVIAMLHGGGALAMLAQRDRGEQSDATPTVTMDFISIPIETATPREVAPGIEQVQAEAAPPPTEQKPDPVREVDPVSEVKPVPASEVHLAESTEIKPTVQEPVPIRELPVIANAEVTLATVVPPPPTPEVKKEDEKSEKKSEAQTVPPMATASVTTAPTAASVPNASLVSWRKRLATHLQRYKRYPAAAQAHRQQGTAYVQFTVDRSGHVTSAKLQRGSGYALLDEETVELVRRAQPLPRPPADITGKEFSFSVPVQFRAR